MTFLLLALAGGAFVLWIYRRREVPVPGRWLLAGARVLALALIGLLLWNPAVPGAPRSGPGELPWLLLDGSLSMAAASGEGPTPWQEALERARAGEWGGVLVFGDDPRALTPEALEAAEPSAPRSRLAPALERAAEAGARRVTVVSDLRVEEPGRVRERAGELGMSLEVESVGSALVNVGIAEIEFPVRADSAGPVRASVTVFAHGVGEADSLRLEVREDGRLVDTRRVPAPGQARLRRVELELPPPEQTGLRRYLATVHHASDAFPDDDARPAWVEVEADEGALVVVSLEPDWEPGFLLPVLERVSGLGGQGYLRVGEGRFLAMAGGPGSPGMVAAGEVRRRMGQAGLLVVHGLDGEAPEWVRDEVARASRLVVFPLDRSGAGMAGFRVGSSLPGEWYPTDPLPASPLAGDLAGADLALLPPMESILPLLGDGVEVPLSLQRQGRGPREAALALLDADGRRRVAVLGRGLWRWAFREGPEREIYHRLWSGVAGWLLAGEPLARGPEVEPRNRVVSRGSPVSWRAPAGVEDPVRLRVTSERDSVVADLRISFREGQARTPALPPGVYGYRALGSDEEILGQGRFDVESYTDELLLPPAELHGEAGASEVDSGPEEGERPLRTHPLPYLLVLGLLSAEWIGRRRKGLR